MHLDQYLHLCLYIYMYIHMYIHTRIHQYKSIPVYVLCTCTCTCKSTIACALYMHNYLYMSCIQFGLFLGPHGPVVMDPGWGRPGPVVELSWFHLGSISDPWIFRVSVNIPSLVLFGNPTLAGKS